MSPKTLVLGIGNILWGDEAFGVRAVEAFHRRYEVPASVTVLDGGTQGLYLVEFVQDAEQLLVFDAIDYGLKPGTLKIVRDGEVPKFTGAKKMSLHQTGFQEVLSAVDLLGRYPRRLALAVAGVATDTREALVEHFGTRWVVVEPSRNPRFALYLLNDPRYRLAFESEAGGLA
ncbi:MAG: HyaD/HybD family hydrogenase maturation endopeptidase [Bacteroidales bacterium]|nr:HyaD/HybD family hydrogenase maturation endopeptidase [Bacteroidales bacterium]